MPELGQERTLVHPWSMITSSAERSLALEERCAENECQLGGGCSLNGSFDQFGGAPPESVTFVILETSMKRRWRRGLDVNAHEVLVYQVGSEVRCVNGEDFAVHTISANPTTIGYLCEHLKLALPQSGFFPEVFCLPGELAQPIRQVLRRFSHHVPDPPHSDLAASQGFWHLGHFTERYRRMFGETPTQTRLRSA